MRSDKLNPCGLLEHYICWDSLVLGDGSKSKKQCNQWCAARSGQYNWREPNRVRATQHSADPSEAKVFRAHAPPQGACEHLTRSLNLLAGLQTGGEGVVDTIFEDFLQEQSRLKTTKEQRRFIDLDNHDAVKIGDMEKISKAIKVVKAKFNREIYQNAAVRDGLDELPLRQGEEGTLSSDRTELKKVNLCCSITSRLTNQTPIVTG